MKFHKFIYKIQKLALYNKSIDNNTLKIFMTHFYSCLSPKEKQEYTFLIDLIREFSKKQYTIDTSLEKIKLKELKTTLKELKNI